MILDELIVILDDCIKKKFFGVIEIHFQGGTPHSIKRTESIKLSSQEEVKNG